MVKIALPRCAVWLVAGNGMYQIAKTLPQKLYQASSRGFDADPKLQQMLDDYYDYIKQVRTSRVGCHACGA